MNRIRHSAKVFGAMIALTVLALASFSNTANAAAAKNLMVGVSGPVSNTASWSGYSAINGLYGATQLPTTNATTVLYIAFTGGTTADISNMVVYKTGRGSTKITSVTPVKLGGISNPSINLTSTSVCPIQPVSNTNPCVIRLDPATLALSPLNDYYFVTFFTSDSNNGGLGAASAAPGRSSFLGAYISGDETHIPVGQSLPVLGFASTYFLMYVMSN